MGRFDKRIRQIGKLDHTSAIWCPQCQEKSARGLFTTQVHIDAPGKERITFAYIFMRTCDACGWIRLEIDGESATNEEAAQLMDRKSEGRVSTGGLHGLF